MPDESHTTLLNTVPQPAVVREQLASHVRQLKLLRQMLRLAERVDAELRAGDAQRIGERNAPYTGDRHAP